MEDCDSPEGEAEAISCPHKKLNAAHHDGSKSESRQNVGASDCPFLQSSGKSHTGKSGDIGAIGKNDTKKHDNGKSDIGKSDNGKSDTGKTNSKKLLKSRNPFFSSLSKCLPFQPFQDKPLQESDNRLPNQKDKKSVHIASHSPQTGKFETATTPNRNLSVSIPTDQNGMSGSHSAKPTQNETLRVKPPSLERAPSLARAWTPKKFGGSSGILLKRKSREFGRQGTSSDFSEILKEMSAKKEMNAKEEMNAKSDDSDSDSDAATNEDSAQSVARSNSIGNSKVSTEEAKSTETSKSTVSKALGSEKSLKSITKTVKTCTFSEDSISSDRDKKDPNRKKTDPLKKTALSVLAAEKIRKTAPALDMNHVYISFWGWLRICFTIRLSLWVSAAYWFLQLKFFTFLHNSGFNQKWRKWLGARNYQNDHNSITVSHLPTLKLGDPLRGDSDAITNKHDSDENDSDKNDSDTLSDTSSASSSDTSKTTITKTPTTSKALVHSTDRKKDTKKIGPNGKKIGSDNWAENNLSEDVFARVMGELLLEVPMFCLLYQGKVEGQGKKEQGDVQENFESEEDKSGKKNPENEKVLGEFVIKSMVVLTPENAKKEDIFDDIKSISDEAFEKLKNQKTPLHVLRRLTFIVDLVQRKVVDSLLGPVEGIALSEAPTGAHPSWFDGSWVGGQHNFKRHEFKKSPDISLPPQDSFLFLMAYGATGHSQSHSLANWGIDVDSSNKFIRDMSLITTVYNFFGNVGGSQFLDPNKIGYQNATGFHYIFECPIYRHDYIAELSKYSESVRFVIRTRREFLRKFEELKNDDSANGSNNRWGLQNIDGEAMFVGTLIHSLDHSLIHVLTRKTLQKIKSQSASYKQSPFFVRKFDDLLTYCQPKEVSCFGAHLSDNHLMTKNSKLDKLTRPHALRHAMACAYALIARPHYPEWILKHTWKEADHPLFRDVYEKVWKINPERAELLLCSIIM